MNRSTTQTRCNPPPRESKSSSSTWQSMYTNTSIEGCLRRIRSHLYWWCASKFWLLLAKLTQTTSDSSSRLVLEKISRNADPSPSSPSSHKKPGWTLSPSRNTASMTLLWQRSKICPTWSLRTKLVGPTSSKRIVQRMKWFQISPKDWFRRRKKTEHSWLFA